MKRFYLENTRTLLPSFNEDANDTGEGYFPNLQSVRMGLDFRIPRLANPGGGVCSLLTFTVLDPIPTFNVNELTGTEMVANFPESGINPLAADRFLLVEGSFPSGVDYDNGQVAYEDTNGVVQVSASRYVGQTSTFSKVVAGTVTIFSFIKINQSLGISQTNFKTFIRPVKVDGRGLTPKQKLYNYVPYPLYLVMKLKR